MGSTGRSSPDFERSCRYRMNTYPTASARPRPSSGPASTIGVERYTLIKAAFQHAQRALHHRHYLEAITLLESILADRLGSLIHGSLGAEVTLRHTLGGLLKVAEKNVVQPRTPEELAQKRSRRDKLPKDLLDFLATRAINWWGLRNHAVHGMAKLLKAHDATFAERCDALEAVALEGFVVLLQLDAFDRRERSAHGAKRPATAPDALAPDRRLMKALDTYRAQSSTHHK